MLKSCLMRLYVGACHMISAEIAVAMAVPIENLADCEARGVIRFLQANEILNYLAEEASSRVEWTMHVRILPGRHKPCCVSNSVGTSSSILRTVRTWHRRTFSCFQKWSTLLVNASQMMKTWRMLSMVYTNWCQGTSALITKSTMWNSRQRYMPKLVYSVSILILKNILVWRNVLYFLGGLRIKEQNKY